MAKVFVICAPSGAGKSSLIRGALEVFPELVFSISVTTRRPRPGEQNGREYHFETRENFEKMIAEGALAEYQEVLGHFYGTPLRFLTRHLETGRDVIMDIDVYGKKKFDAKFPSAVGIFITVPSVNDLRDRLKKRATEGPEDLERRVRHAGEEIEFARAHGKYEYTIVNRTLEEALAELVGIIERESGRKAVRAGAAAPGRESV